MSRPHDHTSEVPVPMRPAQYSAHGMMASNANAPEYVARVVFRAFACVVLAAMVLLAIYVHAAVTPIQRPLATAVVHRDGNSSAAIDPTNEIGHYRDEDGWQVESVTTAGAQALVLLRRYETQEEWQQRAQGAIFRALGALAAIAIGWAAAMLVVRFAQRGGQAAPATAAGIQPVAE